MKCIKKSNKIKSKANYQNDEVNKTYQSKYNRSEINF